MTKTLIITPIKPNFIADLELSWRFADETGESEVKFGALLIKGDEAKLNAYIEKLRAQQLSIGNDDFTIEDRRF